MNMRKIIAVLAAVLMLCAAIPMGAMSVAADGDVIIDYNFDDGNAHFERGYVENGYMIFDATTADWQNCYLYANAMKANTDYVVTFKAKADKNASMSVKINNNWGGDTAEVPVSVTTEWQDFEVMINTGDLTSTALVMFYAPYPAGSAPIFNIDDLKIVEYVAPAVPGQIVNGDFETGDNTGWATHQSTVISADAAYTGSYGANLKGNGGWGGMLNQDIPVEAGKTYEITLWIKVISNGVNFQIKDGGTSGANLDSKWFTATEWTQLTFTVIPTTDIICLNFCGGGNGIAEDLYVDDIVVKELKAPSDDGFVKNGDFETGKSSPWTLYSGSNVSADAAYTGDYGLICTNPNGGWGGTAFQDFSVEIGKSYEVTMWAKAIAQGQNIQIQNGGANAASTWFNKTEWTLLTFEFTATATDVRINICGGGTGANEMVYFDDIKVKELIDPSFDGYIYNGDFETGEVFPWDNLWGSCPTVEIVEGMDGYGLHIVSGKWKHVRQTNIAVEANTWYKVTAWAKNTSDMCLLVKDGGDAINLAIAGMNAGDEWTEFTAVFNSGDYTTILFSLMGGENDEIAEKYGTFDNISIAVTEAPCEHDYQMTDGVWPTCTTEGSATYTCSKCGDSYTETLPAYHNGGMEYNPAKEAIDCANPGNIENYYCPGCHEYFADAYAQEIINPWYIQVTVDCVKPDGLADCAAWTCETCGNENYGAGEHDVLTCQGGVCSKCNAEIEGVGCQNYDTPACQDGVCYYCGGFVAGFGHENGAWAPCCDGECSYGCGLIYPATEDHVDADADNYCDNCWSHLACADADGDGWCDLCWREMPVVEIIYGDANGDGSVNARDAALLQQYVAGVEVTLDMASGDANGDGAINARDAALLQQYVAGWEVTLGQG